jgi:hypothetical protein
MGRLAAMTFSASFFSLFMAAAAAAAHRCMQDSVITDQ